MRQFLSSPFCLICVAVAVMFAGASVQYLFAGKGMNFECTTDFPVTCPANGICQGPGHCTVIPPHKCVNDDTHDDFNKCRDQLGSNCNWNISGCEFEEYMGPGCAVPLGIIANPHCYDECG